MRACIISAFLAFFRKCYWTACMIDWKDSSGKYRVVRFCVTKVSGYGFASSFLITLWLAGAALTLAFSTASQAQVTPFAQAVAEAAVKDRDIATYYQSNGYQSLWTGGGQDPDPVVVDFPIGYLKRTVPVDEDETAVLRFRFDAEVLQVIRVTLESTATVTPMVVVAPWLEAVMKAVPTATAVRRPVASTRTTAGLLVRKVVPASADPAASVEPSACTASTWTRPVAPGGERKAGSTVRRRDSGIRGGSSVKVRGGAGSVASWRVRKKPLTA